MGDLWADLDLRVAVASRGLPIAPLDLDAMSAPARALLPEWTEYRSELADAARKTGSAGE